MSTITLTLRSRTSVPAAQGGTLRPREAKALVPRSDEEKQSFGTNSTPSLAKAALEGCACAYAHTEACR